MVIPLQYAVLVAVGLSVILHVVRQSNQVTIKRWLLDPDGNLIETDPPAQLPANEVVALQPYGSLFFAAAPVLEAQLPATDGAGRNSVVIIRLRGRTDLGTTFMDVLHRYAQALAAAGSKLVIVSASERIQEQLRVTGVTDLITPEQHLQRRRAGGRHPQARLRRRDDMDRTKPASRRDRPAVSGRATRTSHSGTCRCLPTGRAGGELLTGDAPVVPLRKDKAIPPGVPAPGTG